ncbi:ATP-binding protein [Streptomyces sp. NPDC005134]|uniref:ATP-binding protein n=1 Tax=Streptomyces sp. NPDC005098 TaxID=3154560 RepID=UPI0033B06C87
MSGPPYDSTPNETFTLIAAELAANAVRHGHVSVRDFRVRLIQCASEATTVLRIEVADTRTERCPSPEMPTPPATDEETGCGLFLVSQLAARRPLVRGTPCRSPGQERMGGTRRKSPISPAELVDEKHLITSHPGR